MAMFNLKRLWRATDKDFHSNETDVEVLKENQPFNPYTELLLLKHHTDIVRLILLVDQTRCVSAADDNQAVLWNIQLGFKLTTFIGHTRPITAVVLLPSKGDYTLQLLTGSSDKHMRIWDLETGDCLKIINAHDYSVKCLLLLGGGQFCSGGRDISIWNRDGDMLSSYTPQSDDNDVCLLIGLRNSRIVTAVDKQLVVYTVTGEIERVKKLPPHREAVRSLINVSDNTFASGSIDGTIILWKTDTLLSFRYFNSVNEYQGQNKTFPYSIQHMICVEQQFLVAAVGSGFCLYDTETGRMLIKKRNAHYSKICCLTFVCDGLFLVSASTDGAIRLWGYKHVVQDALICDRSPKHGAMFQFTGKMKDHLSMSENTSLEPVLLGECLAHSGAIQVLQDCDGECLVSCGADGLVIVWKNENLQMMKRSHVVQTQILSGGIV